jgi:hypothetical protein
MADKNIWKHFADLNGMTQEEFSAEIITVAQACLAMKLNEADEEAIKITSGQYDGVYELTFRRIIK